MGSITTGIGLISGIDTASLIDSIIALESRGKISLQNRLASLQSQQTALLDINARLLNFKTASASFRLDKIFQSVLAKSNNEDVLTATATTSAQPGTYSFIVKQLVANSQVLSGGFADADTTPLGLDELSFEFGQGRLSVDRALEELNGGLGVDRGKIRITGRDGVAATIDLTDVTTINEVLDRINENETVDVTARIQNDVFVITDNTTGGGSLTIQDFGSDTTATELGIVGSEAGGVITGTTVHDLAGTTALASLNDGTGVLVRNNVDDLSFIARNGTAFSVDLGRIDEPVTDATLLADLNNGAGVTFDDDTDTPDITLLTRDGTEYEVDLSGITTVGDLRTRVANETGGHVTLDVVNGDQFLVTDTIGGAQNLRIQGAGATGDDAAEDLGILNETGVAADTYTGSSIPSLVDKPAVTTVQALIDRINGADGNAGEIVASIAGDGVSLLITDTTGGGGNLVVTSTVSNPTVAADLGIDTGALGVAADTIDGERILGGLDSVLLNSLNGGAGINIDATSVLTGSTPLADLFMGAGITPNGDPFDPDIRIKDRDDNTYEIEVDGLVTVQDLINAVNTAAGGNVTMSIDDNSLVVTNNVAGTKKFQVRDINGSDVIDELGLDANLNPGEGESVTGVDTDPVPTSVLSMTNRLGVATAIDLSAAETVQQLIDIISDAGAGVTASLNQFGTGVLITDTTGGTGNLVLDGSGASELGISTGPAGVASDSVVGMSLQQQYVAESSKLDDLNYGRGIGLGSFRITDGLGQTAVVSIGGTEKTLYDVIEEINSRGLAVQARINDNGDGLIIEEDPVALGGDTPFVAIEVESVTGSTALDLNIAGTADDVVGGFIDGSYERTVDLNTSDSLEDIVGKINDAGIPVSASVLNTGAGENPYRLNLASTIGGRAGDLVIDTGGVSIPFTELSKGQDAKIFFGATDPSDGFLLTSSTNTFSGVVQGVTIDVSSVSDDPVTLTITRDDEGIVDAMKNLVTTFNDVIGRVNQYDFYDVESEDKGVLLGSPTTAAVRNALYRVVSGSSQNAGGSFRYLSQLGVRVNSDGELTLDETAFREAYANDPDSVESLIAAYDVAATPDEEIAEGVTVQSSNLTINALGFANIFDELLDDLTNSVNGTVALADRGYADQIQLVNSRIETIDLRLENRRDSLTREFAALESALARLQEQAGSLGSLASNVALANSSGLGF